MAAAEIVVSSVYVTACAKMRPVLLSAPSAASVVMTASAIVGTAMNWNSRVKTVAMKLKRSLSGPMPSVPSTAPTASAPSQSTSWRF